MKKLIVFVFLTILIIAVALWAISRFRSKKDGNVLAINIQLVNEKTPKYTINAEYPFFPKLPKELNDEITKNVNDRIKVFKDAITENEKYRQDVNYSFDLNWEPKQLNNQYISFIVRDSSFTGGANLNADLFTINYDVQAKKNVQLADLFQTNNYLQSLSAYVKNDLNSQLKNVVPESFMDEGAGPKAENFQNFVFDNQTIEFYFPKGQVAPAAAGEQHVILPRAVVIKDK